MNPSESSWSKELKELYPFLQDNGENDSEETTTALLSSIRMKSEESIQAKLTFFSENEVRILEVARAIAHVYIGGGRMFSMGNGGSSCDAAHFAVEFQHPVTVGRQALPAINLCNDTAMLTAISNDIGYEHVFVRMLEAHACKADGLIGFSTSGNSSNLIQAFEKGKQIGMTTIGVCGGNGGAMANCPQIDYILSVSTDSIHRIQEVHVTLYHILWDLVHTLVADFRASKQ